MAEKYLNSWSVFYRVRIDDNMVILKDKSVSSDKTKTSYSTYLAVIKSSKSYEGKINSLTLMVGGGWLCPHFFQTAISLWKKGSGGPKFHG